MASACLQHSLVSHVIQQKQQRGCGKKGEGMGGGCSMLQLSYIFQADFFLTDFFRTKRS